MKNMPVLLFKKMENNFRPGTLYVCMWVYVCVVLCTEQTLRRVQSFVKFETSLTCSVKLWSALIKRYYTTVVYGIFLQSIVMQWIFELHL